MDDKDFEAALAAIQLQTRELKTHAQRVLEADEGTAEALPAVPDVGEPGDADRILASKLDYLAQQGRLHVALEDLIAPDGLIPLLPGGGRLPWDGGDVLVVGFAGLVGSLVGMLEGTIDVALAGSTADDTGLARLKHSDLLRRYEAETAGLPIDYTGQGFGGAHHRVTNAGHDLGRPLAALRQIRNGEFTGVQWLMDQRVVSGPLPGNQYGTPFTPAETMSAALAMWVKHLLSDVITPTSLPLPGWTKLVEIAPTQDLHQLFKDLYRSSAGPGAPVNLRSATLTKSLPLFIVEASIRLKLAYDAYQLRGSVRLEASESGKRDEMLLAGHGIVAAVTTGRAVVEVVSMGNPVGLRAINPQTLLRTAQLGLQVYSEHCERADAIPSWTDLLAAQRGREPVTL